MKYSRFWGVTFSGYASVGLKAPAALPWCAAADPGSAGAGSVPRSPARTSLNRLAYLQANVAVGLQLLHTSGWCTAISTVRKANHIDGTTMQVMPISTYVIVTSR